MKKILYMVLISSLFLNTQCKKEKKQAGSFGLINLVTGKVTLDEGGTKKPAAPGDKVVSGMTITTGDKSLVDIYFGINAVRITDNSVLVITEYMKKMATGGEKTDLILKKGAAYSKVVKKLTKKDVYTIGTPTAVASVRGTEFLVKEKEGKSNIACLEGKVSVRQSEKPETDSVVLEQGKEVDVEAGKKLTVRDLRTENRNNIRKVLEDIQEMKLEIRAKFEEQKAEIKKKLEDQKEANRQLLQDQKDKDKDKITSQKEKDKGTISDIKDTMKSEKEKIKLDLLNVKPKINKPDIKKPDKK
jgi:hypothetical protein